jgi:hypothetical protein
LWVVALVALWGWAGVSVANAEPGQTVEVSDEIAASTGTAGDVSSCPVDTVPVQIMTPGRGGNEIKRSAAEISSSLPHFRAFVTTVTEHVNSRLAKDKLCINGAENVESMDSAEWKQRSLLQFVRWPLIMSSEFLVPMLPPGTGGRPSPSCRIFSPWIDLVVHRTPVPQIRGVVRWNERQLLADQAVLSGAKNVPPGVAMPLKGSEFGHFRELYRDAIEPRLLADWVVQFGVEIPPELAEKVAKPIKEQPLPDLLWLASRYPVAPGESNEVWGNLYLAMDDVTKKSMEGYTKLIIALTDRCFTSDEANFHYYGSILDVADPVLLEQYKIDTPPIH